MKSSDDRTLPLPLMGGVIQAQRLVVPPEVVMGIKSWRHACRLAWKLRNPRITLRTFGELTECYVPHCSDYFSVRDSRRELPARKVGVACLVLGNTVMAQWLAQESRVTLMEELQVQRDERQRRVA